MVANKMDTEELARLQKKFSQFPGIIFISAKENINIQLLKQQLLNVFESQRLGVYDTIVSNARHANALKNAYEALQNVNKGLDENIASDFLALDIRHALEELGNITGQVTNEDLLENIFSKFCIGK
jgi:tRNA modification GTPase